MFAPCLKCQVSGDIAILSSIMKRVIAIQDGLIILPAQDLRGMGLKTEGRDGVYTAKYLACGWCTSIAEVVASGTISIFSVRETPILDGSSRSKTSCWESRSGHDE